MNDVGEDYIKEAFRSTAASIVARSLKESAYRPTLGLEMEYSVVFEGTTRLIDQGTRDKIISLEEVILDEELGASQIEVKSHPYDLSDEGFLELERHLHEREAKAVQAAAACGAEFIRLGSFPLCLLDKVRRTSKDRYDQYQQWVDRQHCPGTSTAIGKATRTTPAHANVMALMNSVQFNFATRSPYEAVELLNISFALTPEIVALAGNARFLDYKDTGYADVRMLMWERTHDTRSVADAVAGAPLNVGAPVRYFVSIEEYLEHVGSFLNRASKLPFIQRDADRAFDIGTGLCWLDAKLKFTCDRILLEFRPVSMQPSIAEDLAISAFYVGLLEYYRTFKCELPRIEINRLNRYAAMRDGLRANFLIEDKNKTIKLIPVRSIVAASLEKAAIGLRKAGFDVGVSKLSILSERLNHCMTPSDELAHALSKLLDQNCSFQQALEQTVRNCVVRQSSPPH